MDAMEEKLNSILNNPEMMRSIMTMAQSFGGSAQTEAPKEQPQAAPPPEFDLSMLQKISGLARQGSIDKEQQTLLNALRPYLSRQRIQKLENAMRAAKMARFAASSLGQNGLQFPFGR